MAEDATQEPHAELGQLSQTSPATATAAQPTVATAFHLFAFLPEEIRRMIWQHACFPIRLHDIEFPKSCTLPRGHWLSDPADAPLILHEGVRDDLASLIANSENYQQHWSVPGCVKYRNFYHRRDFNKVGAACPEAREAFLKLGNHNHVAIKKGKKGIHVNECLDIFRFSCSPMNWELTTFLLNTRPRLCPSNIAIVIDIAQRFDIDHLDLWPPYHNFIFDHTRRTVSEAFPRWLRKAIKWGREAREGYNNSPTTTLTPSIDDVAINLQDLQAIFLVDCRIRLRQHETGEQPSNSRDSDTRPRRTPLAHQYNILAHGMFDRCYGLSPENDEMMSHWDVPADVWPVLRETKRFVGSSEHWKINIYLMAAIAN